MTRALGWSLCVCVGVTTAFAQPRVTSRDERFEVPNFLWAASAQPPQGTAVENARRALHELRAEYRLSVEQLARLEVSGVHDLHDGTAVIVAFSQRVSGVPVFRDEVKVVMTSRGELVAISGHVTPMLDALGPRRLSVASALGSAWLALEGRALPAEAAQAEHDEWWRIEGAREPARVRAVWWPEREGLLPAYWVELAGARTGLHAFVISAIDGAVLFRQALTVAHSYLVYADPVTFEPLPGPRGSDYVPSPGVGYSPLGPFPAALVSLAHAGLSTQDPWLAPGAIDARGNNVVVSLDLAPPDGFNAPDEYVPVSAPGVFNWPADFGASPTTAARGRAGGVQLFYVLNYLHDFFYDDGFDEGWRNAQADNYGRGGAQGDVLFADSLDWWWMDNATMATPSDGRSPKLTSFVWSGAPNRDGSLDTGLIAHEFGHYLSNRLIGDANGLDTVQAVGLGEGWGDFTAALVLANEADIAIAWNQDWQGAYPLSTWAMTGGALHFGLRRWPLSSSFSHNPLTFRHISDGVPLPTSAPHAPFFGFNSEVHNTGEVWAVMLWDCYTNLLRDPRFTFAQARARMRRTLVASLKATPVSPTFIEARDAVLAVGVANDPTDYAAFWNAFARRGIGFNAVAPSRFSYNNRPLVEDFTGSVATQMSELTVREGAGSCDGDGVIDSDETGTARVRVRNLGTAPLASVTVTFSASSPTLTFPQGASVTLTNLAPFATADAEVALALSGAGLQRLTLTATATSPLTQAVTSERDFDLNSDVALASAGTDDVEVSPSTWAATAALARDPGFTFSRRELTPTQHVWWAPSASVPYEFFLTSPPLALGANGLRLNFRHRFDFDREANDFFDGAVIEVSTDDGMTWADVGSGLSPPYPGAVSTQAGVTSSPLAGRPALVGQSAGYPSFENATIELPALAGQTVRLRFRAVGDEGVHRQAVGWELDDLQFVGLTAAPFPALTVDPNRCSNQPPSADAGADFAVDEGARVVLVGSGADPEGASVTLRWEQASGPPGALQGAVFIAPEVVTDTPVTLRLIANDGRADSAPDDVVLLVHNVNRVPTVTAPASRVVQGGERVTLTASGRDSDGEPVTFAWSQQSGPVVTLDGSASATVSFDAPLANEEAQVVVLTVVARDAVSSSASAPVSVTVEAVAAMLEPPKKPGCGCTGGPTLLAVAALLLVRRRARRE